MFYAERKKKSEYSKSKLVKEFALFLLLCEGNGIKKKYLISHLSISGRTVSRYIDELNLHPLLSIHTDYSGEVTMHVNEMNNYDIQNIFFGYTDEDEHTRKLKQIISIFLLFQDDFLYYMFCHSGEGTDFYEDYQDYYWDADCDYYVEDEDNDYEGYFIKPPKVTTAKVCKKLKKISDEELNISARTMQRNVKLIYEGLELATEVYE